MTGTEARAVADVNEISLDLAACTTANAAAAATLRFSDTGERT